MNSFDFFDRIYCVHLPDQVERKKLMDAEFKKLGVLHKVTYVGTEAPPKSFSINNMRRNPPAEFGCNLSQIKAVILALKEGAQHPLFLEDDVVFNKGAEDAIATATSELPDDWRILYFDGHPKKAYAKHYSSKLVSITYFCFADAYSINQPYIHKYVDFWLERITKKNAMYDFILGEFAALSNSFCIYPTICHQREGVSIISGKFEKKDGLTKKPWEKIL